MQLRHAAQTDVGRAREHNEDTFAIEAATDRPEGALFVVCDGAGGLAAGETASDLAARLIVSTYDGTPGPDRAAALRKAFAAANTAIWTEGRGNMGTTAVAAVFINNSVLIGNVGDSRAILVRGGEARQLTHDHSFVAEQVAAGVITAEQARVSSYRNIITRALGNRPEVEVDLFSEQLKVGDCVVLCSDGLHGLVDDSEIVQAVTLVALQKAVDRLIALANERGGTDNITVVAVEVMALSDRVTPLPSSVPTTRLSATGAQSTTSAGAASSVSRPIRTEPGAVRPPLPAASTSGGGCSFVGWLFVALALLALIGTLAYFAFTNMPTERTTTPSQLALTPSPAVAATANVATPTLIPTPTLQLIVTPTTR